MIRGESVPQSWLVYLQQSDEVFCLCCKLFGYTTSSFCSGVSTRVEVSEKLKGHDNGNFH